LQNNTWPAAALADPGLRAALAGGLDGEADRDTARLAAFLAEAFGPSTAAIVHYGSHVTAKEHRPGSARDYFVVVDDYDAAYASLVSKAETGMTAARAARLARILPPNVVSVIAPGGELHAKCAVLSTDDFLVATSPRAPDHFTRGRLFQHVQLVWTRDEGAREMAVGALVSVRAGTYAWARPSLPTEIDAASYCRALLETSFAAEIRPEKADRTAELLAQQAPVLIPVYTALLAALADAGELLREGSAFRLAHPPAAAESARQRAWFARSKARATLRWAKYVALYDDWLDYVVRKVERRTGVQVQLTPRERRWPLVFLWPKALRFLRDRPQQRRPE
jgi:hypothetical protein